MHNNFGMRYVGIKILLLCKPSLLEMETAEDYEKLLGDLFSALYDRPFLCGYCYTQLTDTMQETNGLLDAARKPKLDEARIRAIIVDPARSIPAEKLEQARKKAQGQA